MAEPSPHLAMKKGANDRAQGGLKTALRLLGRTAPGLAASVADRLFFTPPRPRRSRGDAMLRSGQSFRLRVEGRFVAGWRWGRGPAVGRVTVGAGFFAIRHVADES